MKTIYSEILEYIVFAWIGILRVPTITNYFFYRIVCSGFRR